MKKLLALAALVLGLASCQTEPEGLDVNVGGSMNTVVTVTIPEAETRAYSDSRESSLKNDVLAGDATLRYILQIYDEAGTASEERLVAFSDDNSVNFDVRLIPGRDYQFVVWVDIVDGEADVDKHYVTKDANGKSTLNNITLIESTWKAMDESRDAFTTTELIENFNSQSGITLTAKRPFAKLRVVSTDTKALNNLHITPTTAVVRYSTKHRTSFNAYKGTFGDATLDNKTHEYTIVSYGEDVENGANRTLFTDYFFADNDIVKFYFTVNDQNGNSIIEEETFNTDIYVKRNHLTTIMGNILTDNSNFTIIVEDEFDGELEYNVSDIKSASDLQKAINDATDGANTVITLGADINDGIFPIIVPENKVITLKLNGKNITTPEESTDRHYYAFDIKGALTIEGEGVIKARGNYNHGTMTLESGSIVACDGNGGYGVRNYENATFVMNGGSISTSLEDDHQVDEGGYDATTLRVDVGATATINGGTINNICDYTFAIENHGTTTVNGGEMISVHSTVSTYGTMTINGGSFKCNGLDGITAHALIAWDGSETTINGGTFDGKDNYNGFNVNSAEGAVVNINGGKFLNAHSGSLYGDGSIVVKGGEFFDDPSARVATGYLAIEINPTLYTVMKGSVENGVNTYIIEDTFDFTAFSTIVDMGATFEGTVVKVINDINVDLGTDANGERISFNPIGQRDKTLSEGEYKAFKGTFDGQNHTISGYYQNGWDFGYESGQYGAIGLFSRIENATIKNLSVEGFELRVEGGNVAAIVGNAKGNCTFENITVKSGIVCAYNNGAAGIVAWPEEGDYTFKNIVLEEDLTIAAFWGTYDASLGGVMAEAYPDSSYLFEDITINCRLDAYNDVCANYQWWCYRYSGMIVGNVDSVLTVNDRSVSNPAGCNITCNNVTVNYGDWMNYHYCESEEKYGKPSYADPGEWKFGRVEAGYSYGGFDHTQCNHDTDESHYVCIPFDQLFGGNGQGVYGLAEYPGVTVNYPASYVREVSSGEELKKAFEAGANVVLSADVTLEKITPIAEGKEVYLDLNGKTITVNQNTTSNTLIWVKDGAKLTVDGNGTIDLQGVSTMAIFCPYGELVINNGTFKRNKVTTVTDATTGLFMGAKSSGCNVTINGGYFDSGYYDNNAADIEEILAGTKAFDETADDIAKRGQPGDANLVRVAIKDNVSALLNHSGYGSFKVYGGTFVGANPAWGDEGCMLPTTSNYLRPWSYYQGALLDGQTFNENGLVIPDGYTITKGATADGVPTYKVEYNK